MQINISDNDISGNGASASNGFHSKKSVDVDSLMNNLTKPSSSSTKNSVPEHTSNTAGAKKTDFFGKK